MAEMMRVKNFTVRIVERKIISDFIEKNHYSKSINGCISDYCFALYNGNDLIGAAFFGRLAMANQWKKYVKKESDIIELRRLCCVDVTPKNTESFFIGKMLAWLKKNTEIKTVLSYADEEHGHKGVIYKASNFKYLGKTSGAKVICWGEKTYHDKAIRTKYKGKLKPFAVKIKTALETGEAFYKNTKGKHVYVYELMIKEMKDA